MSADFDYWSCERSIFIEFALVKLVATFARAADLMPSTSSSYELLELKQTLAANDSGCVAYTATGHWLESGAPTHTRALKRDI